MTQEEMQAAIFASFPEWRELAQHGLDVEQEPYVWIEVPTPAEADVKYGLSVSTAEYELTVSFDASHRHFNHWLPFDDNGYVYEGALQRIQAIMREEVVSCSWWLDEHWLSSGFHLLDEIDELPSYLYGKTYNYKRIRSWRGTYNADIRS